MFARPLLLTLAFASVVISNNLADLDKNLLEAATTMKVEALEEAIETYDRLKSPQMAKALSEILLSKDPKNALASRHATAAAQPTADAKDAEAEMPTRPAAATEPEPEAPEVISPEDLASMEYHKALDSKDFAAAEKAIQKWDERSPGNKQSALWKAQLLLDQEKAQEALASLEAASAAGTLPPGPRADLLKAYALVSLDRAKDAAPVLETLLKNQALSNEEKTEVSSLHKEVKASTSEQALEQALEEKNAAAARLALTDYLEAQKDPDYAKVLESRIDALEGNSAAALEKLSQVKLKYSTRPFPAQMDLASAYLATGNYAEATEALDEIVTKEGYEAELVKDAKSQLRDIMDEDKQAFQIDGLSFTADEGDAFYTKAAYKSDWSNGCRWQVWTRFDSITLAESSSYVNTLEHDSVEGGIRYHQVNDGLLWGGSIGATSGYPILSASIGKKGYEGWRWNVEGAFNEIVTSSLQLQAVEGRQHRFSVSLEKQLSSKWYFDITAQGRWVHLDYTKFGTGGGVEYSLLHNLITTDDGHPSLRLGYLGNVQMFSGDTSDALEGVAVDGLAKSELASLPENLMEKNINQHGLLLEWNGRISDGTSWSVGSAALYDTYDARFEYIGRANVNCWLSNSTRLSLGVEYLSAGQGANNEGAIVTGTAGLLVAF